MPIKTKTTWSPEDPPGPLPIEHQKKLAQMIADGKTDGEWEKTQEGDQWVVVRTWRDMDAAQEWIDFGTSQGARPGMVRGIVEES